MNILVRSIWAILSLVFTLPALAGSIAGTVRDSESGLGINAGVNIYDSEGTYINFVFTNNEGQFLTEGAPGLESLESGTYYAKTINFIGHFNKLYDDISCTELTCVITNGTPIVVTKGQTTAGIDFHLVGGGGLLRGRVTDDQGNPLPGNQSVFVYDEAGTPYTRTFDAGQGYGLLEGLPPGIYFAAAFSASDVAHQIYGGRPCINAICQPELGQPITIVSGQTREDINFSLQSGGSISGIVTDEDNGGAPAVVGVSLYNRALIDDGAFGYVGTAISSGADGTYTLFNVPPGDYHVSTGSFGGFDREIYDDIVCEGLCDPAAGAIITVAGDEDVADISFALGSGGHVVTGTVSDGNGNGTGGIVVEIFDAGGTLIGFGRTNGIGGYGISTGLPDGTYYMKASDALGRYVPELFGDVVCISDCDPTTGQPLILSGGGGSSETVNFELGQDRIFKGVFDY